MPCTESAPGRDHFKGRFHGSWQRQRHRSGGLRSTFEDEIFASVDFQPGAHGIGTLSRQLHRKFSRIVGHRCHDHGPFLILHLNGGLGHAPEVLVLDNANQRATGVPVGCWACAEKTPSAPGQQPIHNTINALVTTSSLLTNIPSLREAGDATPVVRRRSTTDAHGSAELSLRRCAGGARSRKRLKEAPAPVRVEVAHGRETHKGPAHHRSAGMTGVIPHPLAGSVSECSCPS